MGNNYKTCIKCQKELPATREFFYKGDCKFGLRNVCKVCCDIYYKQYYKDNKDKNNKRSKKWQDDNVAHCKKYYEQYHNTNKERRNKESKEWRTKNADRAKQYRKNNKDKILANAVKYRTRKLNQMPLDANMELIRFYYTVASTLKDYQVDHMKPLNKGGLHHEDNLQLLEASLNQQKRDKWPLTPEEEIKYKGYKLGVRSLIKKY